MGAAVSQQYTEVVNKVYAKNSNEIVSEASAQGSQNQIIFIQDVGGDVIVDGNSMYQQATINMVALQSSMAESTTTQQITSEILQQVKAEISGINFFNFAVTDSTIKAVSEATVEVVSSVTNSCNAYQQQNQSIIIQTVDNDVVVSNNNMKQFQDIFFDCTQEAVSKNAILQDLDSSIEAQNEASAEGISALGLVILLMLIFFGPYFFNAAAFLKMIFPIFIIIGVLRIVKYFGSTYPVFYSTYFSQSIAKICPEATLLSIAQAGSREDAERLAKNQEACVAYDLNDTTMEMRLYSAVSNTCKQRVQNELDTQPIVQPGRMLTGTASPTAGVVGNGYLNTSNADYWLFLSSTASWSKQGNFANNQLGTNTISWGTVKPLPDSTTPYGTIYVWYEEVNPDKFTVYVKESNNTWSSTTSPMRGPGLVPYDSYTYWISAFVDYKKDTSLLITGIVLIIFGIVGYRIADKKSSKGKKDKDGKHHDNDRRDNDRHTDDSDRDDDDRRDDDDDKKKKKKKKH